MEIKFKISLLSGLIQTADRFFYPHFLYKTLNCLSFIMLASHQIYAAWANPAGMCGEQEPRLMTHRVTSSCVVSSVRVCVIVTWLAAAVWQELWWGGSQAAINLFCQRKSTAAKSHGALLTMNRKSCVFLAVACLVWVQPEGLHAVNGSEPPQCIGVAVMWSTGIAQKHSFYLPFFCHHLQCLLLLNLLVLCCAMLWTLTSRLSLCSHLGHHHLLCGLLSRPPQLPVAFCQETSFLQMQVKHVSTVASSCCCRHIYCSCTWHCSLHPGLGPKGAPYCCGTADRWFMDMCIYCFLHHFVCAGSRRTTCHICTNGHRSACCCCRPSASASASPGWCSEMKISKRGKSNPTNFYTRQLNKMLSKCWH